MVRPLFLLLLFSFIVFASASQEVEQVEGVNESKSVEEQTLELESAKVKVVGLKYEHIKTYSFGLEGRASFSLKTDHDVEIKAVFNVYWGDSSAYEESGYHPGEEVSVSIFQENGPLLFSDSCHRSGGFRFLAKKDHTYQIHFGSEGRKKLVSLMMENYISHRKGAEKLHTQHLEQHEVKTTQVRHRLKSFLSVLERNAVMSQQVARNIAQHSRRYRAYQVFEMLLIVLGACT